MTRLASGESYSVVIFESVDGATQLVIRACGSHLYLAFKKHVEYVVVEEERKKANCEILFRYVFKGLLKQKAGNQRKKPTEVFKDLKPYAKFIWKYKDYLQNDAYVELIYDAFSGVINPKDVIQWSIFDIEEDAQICQNNISRLLKTVIVKKSAPLEMFAGTRFEEVKNLCAKFRNILSGESIDNDWTKMLSVIAGSFSATLRDKCLAAVVELLLSQKQLSYRETLVKCVERNRFFPSAGKSILSEDIEQDLLGEKCKKTLVLDDPKILKDPNNVELTTFSRVEVLRFGR
jgi:hypothetical protein